MSAPTVAYIESRTGMCGHAGYGRCAIEFPWHAVTVLEGIKSSGSFSRAGAIAHRRLHVIRPWADRVDRKRAARPRATLPCPHSSKEKKENPE